MRVRMRLALMGVVVGALAAAAPAGAINDRGCRATTARLTTRWPWVTHWGRETPASTTHAQVSAVPVSRNNAGVSTGAMGQERSNAIGTCHNSLP